MKLKILILIAAIALLNSCQNKQANITGDSKQKNCCVSGEKKSYSASSTCIAQSGVQVIYFHNQRRCATCMAVEEGAQTVVSDLKDSSITFTSYQIGDPKSAEAEKKFEIAGQTLLIIGKGQILDVTNMAFLNARVKPETYKEELNKQISKLK